MRQYEIISELISKIEAACVNTQMLRFPAPAHDLIYGPQVCQLSLPSELSDACREQAPAAAQKPPPPASPEAGCLKPMNCPDQHCSHPENRILT